MFDVIAILEVEEAIKQKTAEREQSIAQANFAAGQISAWSEILERLKQRKAEAGTTSAQPETAEPVDASKPTAVKKGNGALSLTK